MEKYQKINILRIDTEVSEIELRKNWFFQKFKCKISFYNIWEPKMSQLIVIGSHWGFAGCSLVSQWGSLRVIWWSFGGHSGFLKKFNFEFGNKFDYLICHSVIYIYDSIQNKVPKNKFVVRSCFCTKEMWQEPETNGCKDHAQKF